MKGLIASVAVAVFALAAADGQAASVGYQDPMPLSVKSGDNVVVTLVGSAFPTGTSFGKFDLTFDTSVLSYVSFTVPNPPWDFGSVVPKPGDPKTLVIQVTDSDAEPGADFSIVSLTFKAIGAPGTESALLVGLLQNEGLGTPFAEWRDDDGQEISVTYANGPNDKVGVVPLPAAAWFTVSALGVLAGVRKRRAA